MSGAYHLLAALVLLAAFALPAPGRLTTMVALYRAQSVAVALAALQQGFAQASLSLYLTGAITAALGGFALPALLRRGGSAQPVQSVLPRGIVLLLGLGLVGIAVLVVPAGSVLMVPLAVLLLGLLVILTGRDGLAQALGFLCVGNGLLLAAIGLPGLPFTPILALALLAPPALLLRLGRDRAPAGLWDRR